MNLLQMSFSGAVMILAVIVIRTLAINLLPKRTFLILWGIVVLRLLIPFSIPYELIDVISATEMVFHFKDGRTVSRTWEQPKRVGRPWTDEQRAKFKESIKGRYTPEVRQQMSEHMKQLRKERGKAWRKEK